LKNLLGENPDPALIENLSNEKQVTKDTPPTFLAHTAADTAVPAQNSIVFASACLKHGVPVELHVFEKGVHGLGTGWADRIKPEPSFQAWPALCAAWLKSRGFVPPEQPRLSGQARQASWGMAWSFLHFAGGSAMEWSGHSSARKPGAGAMPGPLGAYMPVRTPPDACFVGSHHAPPDEHWFGSHRLVQPRVNGFVAIIDKSESITRRLCAFGFSCPAFS
jgi:hypothetical protein